MQVEFGKFGFYFLKFMRFRTEMPIAPFSPPLGYEGAYLLLGSCFTEAIGRRMQRFLFDCVVNPFGILFNPRSVLQALERMAVYRPFEASELEESGEGYFFSWQHHGRFAAPSAGGTLRLINKEYALGAEKLSALDCTLLLTWGTSYVYVHKQRGEAVANCHKFPAGLFSRRRMEVGEIVDSYGGFLERWLGVGGGGRRVVLTVSPVRHLRDGLHENQLSKGILLLAAEELCRAFPGRVLYFPAYELLLDDLRDYRFYGPDLLHPSEQAEEYIFGRFCGAAFPAGVLEAMRHIGQWVQMKEHKPLHPFAKSLAAFEQKVQEKKKELLAQYPFLAARL